MAAHPLVYPYKLQGRPHDGQSFAALDGSQSMYNKFVKNLDIPEYHIVGDSTVSRIIDDGLINFAQHACNDSKILLLLRDPVERCYSQMEMRVRLGKMEKKKFLQIIRNELKTFQNEVKKHPEVITELWDDPAPLFRSAQNCMYEGAYVVHLRRLLNNFPKERVRIYWSDDFFADPAGVLRDALKFVGVNPDVDNFDPVNVTTTKFNTRSKNRELNLNETISMELREEMAKAMRPFDEQLMNFLGDVPPWIRLSTAEQHEPKNASSGLLHNNKKHSDKARPLSNVLTIGAHKGNCNSICMRSSNPSSIHTNNDMIILILCLK